MTRHYNNQAVEYAAGDPVKESAYLDSLSTQKVWLGYTLKECREMEITLGLDLKGGMNVVLELNVADVIRSLSNNNQDENFNKALDLAYARQATSQKGFIDLFAEEYKNLDSNARLATVFSTFELKDKITPQSTDAQVIAVLKEELQSAIDNSFNVLRTRIDRFGVVSPNIQRLETAGRILVELPGVKEPERVRKLLQGSANLEFWETYQLTEIYQNLVAADNVLATVLNQNEAAQATDEVAPVAEETKAEEAKDSTDIRLLNACGLGVFLGVFFSVLGILIVLTLDTSVYLPVTLERRYHLVTLGAPFMSEFSSNLEYMLGKAKKIAVVYTDVPVPVKEMDGLSVVICENPVEKPEELMKIRECDAVVLCVKAAGKNGKRIERCLEQLARQDIAVTATVLVEADEKLINAYYGSKK